ncbi:hypothetical protein SNEBB_004311 [Seison nebaliae]|nr:hypothetical protein SNEBB_004311 [Seison nebaliae]
MDIYHVLSYFILRIVTLAFSKGIAIVSYFDNFINIMFTGATQILTISMIYYQLATGKRYLSKVKYTSVSDNLIICQLSQCSKSVGCIGIYTDVKTNQLIQIKHFSDTLFKNHNNLFIEEKYSFIYDKLESTKSYRSKTPNYFYFAESTFTKSKTFNEYANGFYYNSENYYLGNEFLYQLSKISKLCLNHYIQSNLIDGESEYCGTYFSSKTNRYKATVGEMISKYNRKESLNSCEGGRPMGNNIFQVSGKYAFWGNCHIPYKQVLFSKLRPNRHAIRIRYDFL